MRESDIKIGQYYQNGGTAELYVGGTRDGNPVMFYLGKNGRMPCVPYKQNPDFWKRFHETNYRPGDRIEPTLGEFGKSSAPTPVQRSNFKLVVASPESKAPPAKTVEKAPKTSRKWWVHMNACDVQCKTRSEARKLRRALQDLGIKTKITIN